MNLNTLYSSFGKVPSLQSFSAYRDLESQHSDRLGSVSTSGDLLEYETLALRCVPPVVRVDNDNNDECTIITVDSANRPGTLVEVVQHFTELGLDVRRARISSDGGWFVDVFEVTETNGTKVTDKRKHDSIKQMLSISTPQKEVSNADETDDYSRIETTVFELAGQDQAGLLADVTHLLTTNGCDVRSAAVWTYKNRVAFVLSVTELGGPVRDCLKLRRLQELLLRMMDEEGTGIVNIKTVRGEVHHDRRLHQLMLCEEEKAWKSSLSRRSSSNLSRSLSRSLSISSSSKPRSMRTPGLPPRGASAAVNVPSPHSTSPSDSAGSMHGDLDENDALAVYRSPKHSKPEINITHCGHNNYWLVTIKCKDRNKLLFDTVCTLADLDYDVYHATIDGEHGVANQEYYIKPRLGMPDLDEARAAKLRAMLESSIQRRFPRGLKVHVQSTDRFGCLAALTRVFKQNGLSITRAKVKTYAVNKQSGHTFYIASPEGTPLSRAEVGEVQQACRQIGGKPMEDTADEDCSPATQSASTGDAPRFSFSFSFLNRQWHKGWGGDSSSPCSSSNGSS